MFLLMEGRYTGILPDVILHPPTTTTTSTTITTTTSTTTTPNGEIAKENGETAKENGGHGQEEQKDMKVDQMYEEGSEGQGDIQARQDEGGDGEGVEEVEGEVKQEDESNVEDRDVTLELDIGSMITGQEGPEWRGAF